jgi:multiple sugar transport system ATP-binding protein
VIVGIRPEDMEDASLVPGAPADRRLRVAVSLRETMGPEAYLHFPIKTPPVALGGEDGSGTDDDGSRNDLTETTFVARVTPRTTAQEGDDMELVVDMEALHFFDPATGDRISA